MLIPSPPRGEGFSKSTGLLSSLSPPVREGFRKNAGLFSSLSSRGEGFSKSTGLFSSLSPSGGKIQKQRGIVLIPLLPRRRIQKEHGIVLIPLPQWGRDSETARDCSHPLPGGREGFSKSTGSFSSLSSRRRRNQKEHRIVLIPLLQWGRDSERARDCSHPSPPVGERAG